MTSSSNTTPIDPATVERCIELLRGTGEYGYIVKPRLSVFEEFERLDQWTYTTHPIDLLRSLIVPEPTEAAKLVSEWLGGGTVDADEDYVRLVQFILDRRDAEQVAAMMAAPTDATSTSEPQYVFGPWIAWQGGECPVPGDWMVDVRFRDFGTYSQPIPAGKLHWWHYKNDRRDITHYRVRFELNRWYGWTGGPCPVGDDVLIAYHTSNGCAGGNARGSDLYWTHPSNGADITRFKITSIGETK